MPSWTPDGSAPSSRRCTRGPETTLEARKCIHYVFGNRHRMRYPRLRLASAAAGEPRRDAAPLMPNRRAGDLVSDAACAGPSQAFRRPRTLAGDNGRATR